jgi:hypothetical protein
MARRTTWELRAAGVDLTDAAAENMHEVPCDFDADVRAVRITIADQGLEVARDNLLAFLLEGAEADRVQGWRDYASAVLARAHKLRGVHHVRVVESNSSRPRLYDYDTRKEALAAASRLVDGCLRGEGYVQVSPGSKDDFVPVDPIKTLRA